MHHRNNRNSTSNFNNPQHHKSNNNIPTGPSPGGRYNPNKPSVLSRIKDRFKEKPATKEEVEQLGLNAKREVFKTQIIKAKKSRPSRFDFAGGGGFGGGGGRSSGGGRRIQQDTSDSWVFGGGGKSSGGGFFESGGDSGPSLDMFKYGSGQKKGKKNQKSGIDELFGSG